MKRDFCPVVTPLEGRALMSAGLKGTASAFGSAVLGSPSGANEISFAFGTGRLGNVNVGGTGLLVPAVPKNMGPKYDYIYISIGMGKRRAYVFGLEMEAIAPPVYS